MIKSLIISAFSRLGYTIYKSSHFTPADYRRAYPELDRAFFPLFDIAKPHTATSIERLFALYTATCYIIENSIPGAFVECGVWRGGSMMMIALTLKELGVTDRRLYLYDTFEGMSEPTGKDIDRNDNHAQAYLDRGPKGDNIEWYYAPIVEVQKNLSSTGYPAENIFYVRGKVEDTIPATLPPDIALLRLDTDWYESTFHEMQHLYPLVSPRGVMIQDDYGVWKGARDATDEYFSRNAPAPLLVRIDDSARVAIKP